MGHIPFAAFTPHTAQSEIPKPQRLDNGVPNVEQRWISTVVEFLNNLWGLGTEYE